MVTPQQREAAVADAVSRQMDFLLESLHSGAAPMIIGCGDEDHYCFSDEMIKRGWLENLPLPPPKLVTEFGLEGQRIRVVRLTRAGGVAYCTQFIEGELLKGPVTDLVRSFFEEHEENLLTWVRDMIEESLGPFNVN